MTVSTTTTLASASGNGSTHSFAYGFKIFADADLQVIIRSSAGAETTKTLNTHYVVTGAGSASGGNVLFKYNTGSSSDAHYSTSDYRPASGETVIIKRVLGLTQSTDYIENDTFSANDHENALDRLTFITQQLQETADRSFKVSSTNSITTPEFTDNASSRASKVLGFSSDGNSLAVVDSIILPTSLSSAAGKMIRVNSGETAYEFQTAAQVFTNLLATEGNGMIAHAGSGAAEPRTITGTSNQITLTNGNGVSGNPVVSIPDAITFTGKTVTGGTFSAMTSSSTLASMGSADLSIASKQYVDQALAGMRTRLTVRAATTANVNLSGGGIANGVTIDGVSLSTGNTVLVKSQSTSAENGLYTVPSSGAASRSTEADTWDEIIGQLISVQEGTANADDLYLNTSNSGGTLNSTAIAYTKVYPGSGGTVTSVSTAGLASGGEITGSGTVTVAINSQSALSASPAAADQFAIYDADATAHKKITTTELFGAADLTATAREYTKTQNFNMTTLSDGANISWDLSQNQVATVTLAGNRTLDAPSNQVAGATYILIVKQDGTGSRTLNTSASAYKWPAGTEPTLTTTASAVDILTFVSDGSSMFGVAQLAFS
tara:strand:- start:577 stop:2394 length:1818 start_codon:yes stop_codon:yes gene_type:complete